MKTKYKYLIAGILLASSLLTAASLLKANAVPGWNLLTVNRAYK